MLEMLQILILAIVQGLTEFLPVSSSGHLVLLQHWFGTAEGDLFLDVMLHIGTLGSVLFVFRREVRRLLALDRAALRYLLALAVGTLPAVAVGLSLRDTVAALFASPAAAAIALLVTAMILFSTRFTRERGEALPDPWQPRAPHLGRALLIGAAQALAITPGISRSGATIAASLWAGLPRAEAARFSFLLSVPAIAGALVLELISGDLPARGGWAGSLLGAAVAFLVGLAAIGWTARAVVGRFFWKFCFYCLALGVAVQIILA